jgi:hypothetical protein
MSLKQNQAWRSRPAFLIPGEAPSQTAFRLHRQPRPRHDCGGPLPRLVRMVNAYWWRERPNEELQLAVRQPQSEIFEDPPRLRISRW